MVRTRVLITRAEAVRDERWEDYADRIAEAGGEPIAYELSGWQADHDLPSHDGVMLTSGADIDPDRYGEPRSDRVLEVSPERDAFEVALVDAAYEADRPLLGICRGHQLLNVARGGSLVQHLEQRDPHRARLDDRRETIVSGWHEIELRPGTVLAGALGVTTLHVNSRHHQAVTQDRVAPGLAVAGTSPDGLVEALADPSRRWVASLQCHPEMAEVSQHFAPLFAAFVSACATAAKHAPKEQATRG